MSMACRSLLLTGLALLAAGVGAQSPEPPAAAPDPMPGAGAPPAEAMTGERLVALVARIDPEYQRQGNGVQFTLRERPLLLVFDENAGRMRVFTPVAQAGILDAALMQRMLQANFDSALDARYAIANEIVWSVFLHPLPTLTEELFANGIAQVVVAAETFGTTFTSGALVYGGGDSNEENRKLLEHLNKLIKPEI